MFFAEENRLFCALEKWQNFLQSRPPSNIFRGEPLKMFGFELGKKRPISLEPIVLLMFALGGPERGGLSYFNTTTATFVGYHLT